MKKVLYLLLAVSVGFGAAKLMDRCGDDSSDNMSYAEEEYGYYEEVDSALILEEGEEYAGADYALLDSVIDWDFDSVYDPNYQYAVEAVEEEPAPVPTQPKAVPQKTVNKVEKPQPTSSLRDKLVARTEELDKIWKKRYLEEDIFGLFYNKEKNKLHILVDFRNKNDDELLNILFEEGDEEELDSELASYAYGIGLHVRTTAFSDDYDGNAPTEDSKLLHKVNPTFTVRILHKKGNGLYEFSIKDTLVDTSSL